MVAQLTRVVPRIACTGARTFTCLLLLCLCSALEIVPQAQDADTAQMDGSDWLNFGPIGAAGDTKGDDLIVKVVHEGGPAVDKLKVGDRIVGIIDDEKTKGFSKTPEESLARYIDELEGAAVENPTITLMIERGENKTEHVVALPLAKLSEYDDFPTKDKKTDEIVRRANNQMATTQMDNGSWFRGHSYYSPALITLNSAAALSLLASGDPVYLPNCKRYAAWLVRSLEDRYPTRAQKNNAKDDGDKGEQKPAPRFENVDNWGWMYSGIFLAEYYLATEDTGVRDKLKEVAEVITKRQEKSGGWGHGPTGPNSLGYLELNVMVYHAIIALKLVERCNIKIDEGVIKKAQDYLEKSIGRKGGIGYSDKKPSDVPGTTGYALCGRTAGCVIAYNLVGNRAGVVKDMRSYVRRYYKKAHEEHASPLQHMLFTAAATYQFDNSTWEKFMKYHKKGFTLRRMADGWFTVQPTEETKKIGMNHDRIYGKLWATAMTTLTLSVRYQKLALFGGDPEQRRNEEKESEAGGGFPGSDEIPGEDKD